MNGGGMFGGGLPGGNFNQGGFPGGENGGFPGGESGGFPGGFPRMNNGGENQGGFPDQGGFPGGNNFGGFGGAEAEQGGQGPNPFGWNDNSWMPGTAGEGAEMEGGFPPLGPDRGNTDVGGNGCTDTISGCKDLKASGMCAVVTECPMTCGTCNAVSATYAVSQQNAYCKSMLNGRTVIKELSQARGAQE